MNIIIGPSFHREYRANIVAQAICFMINCTLYATTGNLFFVWVAISSALFIGFVNNISSKIIDQSLLNHLIVVILYYLIAAILHNYYVAYSVFIFAFTYVFFILKDAGFDKSLTLWTFTQALIAATTFTEFPFMHKVLATVFAFIETQLVLKICFKFIPSGVYYTPETPIYKIYKMSFDEWFGIHRSNVQLALRGALTGAIVYVICSLLIPNDIKPNWATVSAVGCLLRNDDEASMQSIITTALGSFIGWLISLPVIYYIGDNSNVNVVILWISLILGLAFVFEFRRTGNKIYQILSVTFLLLTVTCVGLIFDIGAKLYLNLKIFNTIIGVISAYLALISWRNIQNKYGNY